MGITTGPEAEAYDNAKAARVSSQTPADITLTGRQAGYRPLPPRDRDAVITSGARINAGQHRFLHGGAGTPPPGMDGKRHGDSREHTPRPQGTASRKPRKYLTRKLELT